MKEETVQLLILFGIFSIVAVSIIIPANVEASEGEGTPCFLDGVMEGDGWEIEIEWGDDDGEGLGTPCFVEAAAAPAPTDEDNEEPHLNSMRDFRDSVLMETHVGGTFVDAYYSSSPPIAEAIMERDLIRTSARYMAVMPAAIFSSLAVQWSGILLICGVLAMILSLGYLFGIFDVFAKGLGFFVISTVVLTNLILFFGWLGHFGVGLL